MTDPSNDVPVDPMDDPAESGRPPTDQDAVAAAERMNDPDGPQPGAVDEPPASGGDEPVPEIPQ